MKPFLYKEIKLNLKAVNYLFLAFPAMLIIPNYPVYVPFYYTCLSIFFIFNNANLFKDIEYSMILPIAKTALLKPNRHLRLSYLDLSVVPLVFMAACAASQYVRLNVLLPFLDRPENLFPPDSLFPGAIPDQDAALFALPK